MGLRGSGQSTDSVPYSIHNPNLLRGNLGIYALRKVKYFTQSCLPIKWQNLDINPDRFGATVYVRPSLPNAPPFSNHQPYIQKHIL